jgi:signal transduction histidine kinase
MNLLECHAPRVREHLMRTGMPSAARDGSWSGESVLLTRDGREIRTTLFIAAHRDDDGRLAGFSIQEQDVTERVKIEEALRASENELQRLRAQLVTIQDIEQRRIAVELNGGLGHTLSLLELGIQKALRQVRASAPRKVVDSVKRLIPRAEGALDELRRVAIDSHPPMLDDLGIVAALAWFVREFESINLKTRIEKHIDVTEKDVPAPLKIAIFRILQEAVNNAVKYSDAGCIRVSLHNADGGLIFTIEDDGKGFDPDALASRGNSRRGLGMQSMRERAELSGGTYGVSSAVGRGTRICVRWPVSTATDSDREQAGRAWCGLQSGLAGDGAEARAYYRPSDSDDSAGTQRTNPGSQRCSGGGAARAMSSLAHSRSSSDLNPK